MTQELRPSTEQDLVVFDAPLHSKEILNANSVLLLDLILHLDILIVVDVIDADVNFAVERVIGVAIVNHLELWFIVINALVCLVQKVLEFLQESL